MRKFKFLLLFFVLFIFTGCTCKYEITFVTNNGENVAPIEKIKKGSKVNLPDIAKTGYLFDGWYMDNAFTQPFSEDCSVNGSLTLYAKWKLNSYTLTFESNGGSTMDSINKDFGVVINLPIPTKEGYSFSGWFYDQDLSNRFTLDKMPARNLTLYAKWTADQYTLTFDTNGGNQKDQMIKDYNAVIGEIADPTREGHTFLGWFEDEELTQPFTLEKMPARDLTLFAKWEINQYTITFTSNGGSVVEPITQNYDSALNISETVREGHTFLGWFEDEGLTQLFTLEKMPARNLTLYAKWDTNKYTITLNTNGGSIIETVTLDYQSTLPAFESTREGYAFQGWFEDEGLTQPFTLEKMPAQDQTLYAKWEINKYTITFTSNGGSVVEPITQDYDSALNISESVREGHTFLGWFEDEGLTQLFTLEKMPARNLTLYAKWEINQYTLTFDTKGGSAIDAITQDFQTNLPVVETVKEGYTLLGWYEDEELTQPFSSATMPARNQTLYAKWEAIPYEVTYVTNGGSDLQTVFMNFEEPLNLPTPEKSGFTFAGWYGDDQLSVLFDLENMPSHDLTVYAKWIINLNVWDLSFEGNRYVVNRYLGSPVSLEIPDEINGIVVSRINNRAFYNLQSLEKVVLPDSITSIGAEAFSGCTKLKEIRLSNKLTTISEKVFAGCISLVSLTVPTSVTSIEAHAFDGCQELNNLSLSTNLARIGAYAFSSCLKLGNLVVPGSIAFIDSYAFKDCIGLSNITFPDVFVKLGSDVFSNTAWFTNHANGIVYLGKMVYQYKGLMPMGTVLQIKNGTVGICYGAFKNCNNLVGITLPASVQVIDDYAFEACGSLVNIIFDGAIRIGDGAFKGCVNMVSITVPSTIRTIGLDPFEGCTRLGIIYTPSDNYDNLMQLLNNDARIRSL